MHIDNFESAINNAFNKCKIFYFSLIYEIKRAFATEDI